MLDMAEAMVEAVEATMMAGDALTPEAHHPAPTTMGAQKRRQEVTGGGTHPMRICCNGWLRPRQEPTPAAQLKAMPGDQRQKHRLRRREQPATSVFASEGTAKLHRTMLRR